MSEKVLVSFEVDNAGAIKKVKRFRGEMGEVPEATKKAAGGLAKLKSALVLVGTAFAAIGVAKLVRSLTSVGGAIIRTGAQFETMAIQMRAVTGSSEAAQRATDWIVQFTADTPYQLEQVTNAFVKMRAMGLDPMDGTMQAVADMTSFLGGSMDTMNSIVLALGKSYTVGKISMEEMRMMMERGVPVIDILADKLGVTNETILEMSQKGKLGRESIKLLIEGMGELAGGASASLMESFSGLWSNLQDHITLAMKEMSEGGALDGAKAGLKALVDILSDLRNSGLITYIGESIGEAFNSAIPIIEAAAEGLKIFATGFVAIKQFAAAASLDATTRAIAQINENIDVYAENAQAGGHQTEYWKNKILAAYVELGKLEKAQKQANKEWDAADEVLQKLIHGEENLTKHTRELLDPTKKLAEESKEASEGLGKVLDVLAGGNVAGGMGLVEAVNAGAGEFTLFGNEANTLANAINAALAPAVAKGAAEIAALAKDAGAAGPKLRELAADTDHTAEMMQSTFSNLISKGFTGELESFASIFKNIFGDIGKSMTTILTDAFETSFKTGEGLLDSLKEGLKGFTAAAQSNRAGSIISGVGAVYSGYQQGGVGGFLQGAMGGAQIGAQFGTIGTIVGAVLGGVATLFGGGDDPRASFTVGMDGSTLSTSGMDDIGASDRNLWMKERTAEYRASIMQMNSILRIFADGDLFDMIADAPTISQSGTDLDMLTAAFRERWLPQAMRQMFRGAINRGLRGVGVDEDTLHQLWSEVRELGGTDQFVALESFISSIVGLTNLYDDMDWNAILDASRQDSMSAFLGGMNDVIKDVRIQMLGLDNMTLLERAEQATTIEQMILQARQAEIQMLAQIDNLQKGINDSLDSQIEGIRLGGMSGGQQENYYLTQIQDIMAQLRAGVSSPEAVQALMSDLQRYTGAYQNLLGDSLYSSSGWGGNQDDWLVSLLEEARGLSNDAFEGMRDQIRESNDLPLAELARLIDALQHYGDAVATGLNTTPNLGDLDISGQIDINVHATDGFWAEVEARVEAALIVREGQYEGIN